MPIQAQMAPKEQTSGSSSQGELRAIPLSELARHMEETNLRLLNIQAELAPEARVSEIKNNLQQTQAILQTLPRPTAAQAAGKQSLRMLREARVQWQRYKVLFSNWQAVLIDRSQQLAAMQTELHWMQQLWDLTARKATKENVPFEIRARIQSIQRTIQNTQNQVRSRLNPVLKLQNTISKEVFAIAKALNEFQTLETKAREQWLKLDSPPLWKALTAPAGKSKIRNQFRALWETHSREALRFFRDYHDRVFVHAALGFLLFLFLLLLHWRSKKWDVDAEAFATTRHILSRPLSTTILIELIITNTLYPFAPAIVSHATSLLMLLPLLRLLPGLLSPSMRMPFYLITAMYALQQVYDLAITPSLLQRIFLLLATAIIFIGLIWLIRPGGRARRRMGGAWWHATVNGIQIAAFITLLSLLANIFGNVSLAELLARATLTSIYAAIVLFTIVLVLDSLILAIFQTKAIHSLRMFRNYTSDWKRKLSRLLHFTALVIWLFYTLEAFEIFSPLWAFLRTALNKHWLIGSLDISLADILIFAVAIYLAVQLSKLIRIVLNEDVLPKLDLPRGVPAMISMAVHYLILGFGILIALSAAGIEWSKFALVAGALGVGIGFGLQNLVNNFVSGLILIFERPIKIGDTIEVGELRGIVKRIGIRSSTVRTYDGAEVIVPNANLISNEVINWTLSDRLRRIEIKIGVAYGSDPKQVLEILQNLARKHPDVLDYPEPYAVFLGFGESSLDFSLRFWTAEYENWLQLHSNLAVEVNQALQEAGIEIPFPQRDLHVRSVDETIHLGPRPAPAQPKARVAKATDSKKVSQNHSEAGKKKHA